MLFSPVPQNPGFVLFGDYVITIKMSTTFLSFNGNRSHRSPSQNPLGSGLGPSNLLSQIPKEISVQLTDDKLYPHSKS